MLTTADLDAMRGTVAETFDSTAVIHAGTIVDDGGGGGTAGWTTSGTVPCHISPILNRGEQERQVGERIEPEADWVLTLPAGTSISPTSRVVIDAVAYEVMAVRAPRTWEITRRLEVTKVT